jgi:CDP-diacylglycerol---glycerol-3-phosphate 3-phosphatidyltransferase
MFTLYQIKPKFQDLLRPVVARLAAGKVTPNQVTIAAILLSVVAGGAIAYLPQNRQILLCLPIVLLVRMGLNAIDGMLAREYNLTSELGFILNELGDIISDVALYLPFALISGIPASQIVAIVILAIFTEVVGMLSLVFNEQRQYQGPMGKSDRALVFSSLGMLLGLGLDLNAWLGYLFAGIICLQCWTIANRSIVPIGSIANRVSQWWKAR